MSADWKDALSKLAPTAATLLGGPFAGLAVNFIGQALGVSEPTKQSIQQALTSSQLSGDQIVALKKAELDLQQHLQDNGIELDKIAAADRDSARSRQVALRDWTPNVIALVVLSMAATAYGLLLAGYEPHIAPELVGRILGTLDAVTMLVLTYFFGSTSGSARKTEILAQQSAA